jgi:hypothetical protein
MRVVLVLFTLAFGLLAPGAAVARKSMAHARLSPTCPARQPLLLADGHATIYSGGKASPNEVFGCVRGHRSYDLGRLESPATLVFPGSPTRSAQISQLTIAGQMVAFEETAESRERLVVRDLKTGRFVVRESQGVQGLQRVEQIVVKSDGTVAWMVQVNYGHGGNPIHRDVYAVDASGIRLLAEGEEGLNPIERGSLALAGSTLYWTQGGKPLSAPLN